MCESLKGIVLKKLMVLFKETKHVHKQKNK